MQGVSDVRAVTAFGAVFDDESTTNGWNVTTETDGGPNPPDTGVLVVQIYARQKSRACGNHPDEIGEFPGLTRRESKPTYCVAFRMFAPPDARLVGAAG